MSHQKFLETIWAHRDRLKCSTVVVRAGARKWLCAVCVTPHDVLSPKREQMRRWYRNRGRFQRIEWANAGLCINCGRSCSESASTRYCVKCHAGRLETQRRYRERKQHGITEALYGGRVDFQREQIKTLEKLDRAVTAHKCGERDKQLTIEWQERQLADLRRVIALVAKHADFSQCPSEVEDEVDRANRGEGGPAS